MAVTKIKNIDYKIRFFGYVFGDTQRSAIFGLCPKCAHPSEKHRVTKRRIG